MRSVFFTLCLILFGSNAFAQSYFALGYNLNAPNLEGMNYIVDRYNETRPFLDKTMSQFNFMDGITINFGTVMSGGVFLETGLTKAVKNHKAEGVDATNTLQQRQLRLALVNWDIGMGIAFPQDNPVFSLGAAVNLGSYKVRTRVNEKDQVKKTDWDKILKESMIRFSIFARIQLGSPSGLAIEPYYNFNSILKINVAPVNAAINPATHQSDPSTIEESLPMFGLKLKFSVVSN